MVTFCAKVGKQIGYVVATLVISIALFVSVARVMTPYLNNHLPNFENWASQLLNVPIKIGHVKISWDIYAPVIAFSQVRVLDKQSQTPKFAVEEIKVNLNILSSLIHLSPVPDAIKVKGIHLTIRHPASHKLQVEELKTFAVTDNTTQSLANLNDLFGWVFSQPNLILENVDVNYYLPSGIKKSVTLRHLILTNTTEEHQLAGDAIINQDDSVGIKIHTRWLGNIMDIEHVSAKMYLYVEGISLSQWFSQFAWNNLQVKQGIGSAKIWLTWENNQFQKIQSQFQMYDLAFNAIGSQKIAYIPRLSGHVGWKREGEKQIFSGNDIFLDLPNHLWPTTHFEVTLSPATHSIDNLAVSYLDLKDLTRLASFANIIPDKLQPFITLNPRGEIRDLKLNSVVNFTDIDPEKVKLGVRVRNLSLNSWKNFPGFKNLSGTMNWNGKEGQIDINSNHAALSWDTLFANPLAFDQLSGLINVKKADNQTWVFSGKNIKNTNADLLCQSDMEIVFPANNSSPIINLTSQFAIRNAANVYKYLPLTVNKSLQSWLQTSIQKGQLEEGSLVINGKLSDFPFEKKKGSFIAKGLMKNFQLKYASDWPALTNVNGMLVFSGNSMNVDLSSGAILNTPIASLHAVIPTLNHLKPALKIDTVINTDFLKGVGLVQNSPLQKKLGKGLAALNLTGPMDLKLNLIIPLNDTNATQVQGEVNTQNANINLASCNLMLEQLRGSFQFTENTLTATNLQGQIFNEPAIIDIKTINKNNKTDFIQVLLKSKINTANLQTWLKMPLENYAKGMTDYQAEVRLGSDSSNPIELSLKTDLTGIEINLPEPYGKKSHKPTPLELTILSNDNEAIRSKFNYGDAMSAALSFSKVNDTIELKNGEFHLGGGKKASWQTQPGLVISGHFKQMDWNTLKEYFDFVSAKQGKASQTTPPSAKDTFKLLREVDVYADRFNLLGQSLDKARFQITKQNENWQMQVNSAQVVGQITVPFTLSTITGKFQRLYFSSKTNNNEATIDPATLPALSLSANDVKFGETKIGYVSLETLPIPNGMQVKHLRVDSFSRLNASGFWKKVNKRYTSHLQGELITHELNPLLEQWGIHTSSLVGRNAEVDFDLNWPAAVYNPTVNLLSGQIALKVGAGRVINLSGSNEAKMGLGKLLSILNFQNIPRRLSLNFSDLFQNGYSFDSIQGNFNLVGGNAFTNDLRLAGPVARIDLAGRIGLQAKDYDMKLGVTTYVASSLLPVAIGAAFPLAGVATWVLGSMVSRASSDKAPSSYQYKIIGPWDNPQWNEQS